MKKYFALLSIAWQNGLVYKVSFLLWRFRNIVYTMLPLILWTSVYSKNDMVVGYSQDQMIGYILISSLIFNLVMATALHNVASTIYTGDLSIVLLKPIGLFRSFLMNDIADKLKNIIFSVLEFSLFWFILQPELAWPAFQILAVIVPWVLMGVGIHFFVEMLFGSIGFWSPDVWGPKFLFFQMVELTAGRAFPLDILPQWLQNTMHLTPFPYFGFIQTQAILGRLPEDQFLHHTLAMGFWLLVLGIGCRLVWNHGMKDYSAAGR